MWTGLFVKNNKRTFRKHNHDFNMLQTMFVTGYSVLCDDLFNLTSIFVQCLNAKCLLKTMLLGFFQKYGGERKGSLLSYKSPWFFLFSETICQSWSSVQVISFCTKLPSSCTIFYLLCCMLTASVPLEWEGQKKPLWFKWVPNWNLSIPKAGRHMRV